VFKWDLRDNEIVEFGHITSYITRVLHGSEDLDDEKRSVVDLGVDGIPSVAISCVVHVGGH